MGRHRLVQRHAHVARAHQAQVDASRPRRRQDGRGVALANVHHEGVEVVRVLEAVAQAPQAFGQGGRRQVHPLGDGRQAARTVVHGVHAGHHGQQHLGGANVAGGLLAPDMLLAGLEGQAHGRPAAGILGNAHDASRHLALVGIAGGEIGGVGPPVAQRHPQALGVAQRHVGAPLPRRHQQREGQKVGRCHHQRPGAVGLGREVAVVVKGALGVRILHQHAEHVRCHLERAVVAHHHLPAPGPSPGAHHVDGLGVTGLGHEEDAPLGAFRHGVAQAHGLGRRRGLVQQRGVGHVQARQVHHQGLEVEQGLQAALGDLGLIRGVGRVPAGILQDVAQDHRRRDAVVVAQPQVGAEDLVFRGQRGQLGQGGCLAGSRRQVQGLPQADGLWHGRVHQGLQGGVPDGGQHGLHFRRAWTQVPAHKAVGRFEGGAQVGDHFLLPQGVVLVGRQRYHRLRLATARGAAMARAITPDCRAGAP